MAQILRSQHKHGKSYSPRSLMQSRARELSMASPSPTPVPSVVSTQGAMGSETTTSPSTEITLHGSESDIEIEVKRYLR